MKGCASFAAVFFLGVGLVIGGFVYDSMQSGLPFQEERASERQGLVARVLEVAGVAVSFGAIFGAAGWRFYRRERDPDSER